jgi:hypothetical protein
MDAWSEHRQAETHSGKDPKKDPAEDEKTGVRQEPKILEPRSAALILCVSPARPENPLDKVDSLMDAALSSRCTMPVCSPHNAPHHTLPQILVSLKKATSALPFKLPHLSVAVGTAVAYRPPHRSVRAALPHTALASGRDA